MVEDAALVRVMSYLKSTLDFELTGSLSPDDIHDIEIRLFTDADWAGDASSTKSTNGLWIELYSPSSGRFWGLTWRAWKQTCTSSSTAEAETISLSSGLRSEGYPLQTLVGARLGFVPKVVCQVDNLQAIATVRKGYSKKLKHFQRTHKCSIGVVHESIRDETCKVDIEHHPTATHKGDLFTKALARCVYVDAVKRIGLRRSSGTM